MLRPDMALRAGYLTFPSGGYNSVSLRSRMGGGSKQQPLRCIRTDI
jgi:hypothetical protein